MALVKSFTSERMLEIEQTTIVNGDIVGDDLILYTREGTPINTGRVTGDPGPKGDPGTPGAPGTPGQDGADPPIIRDETVNMPQRPAIAYVGAGVTVTDDSSGMRTVVTIPGPPAQALPTFYGGSGWRTTAIGLGAGAWTTLTSIVMSNVPAGKYLCVGHLSASTSALIGGSIRFNTNAAGESQWVGFNDPANSGNHFVAQIEWLLTHPGGALTVNLQANPTIAGMTAQPGAGHVVTFVGV